MGEYIDISLEDGTRPKAQHVTGMLNQLLQSVLASNGNILTMKAILSPMIDTPGQITWVSDQRAWVDTIDLPYCKHHVALPLSHL